jgi:molybdopterin molybdotransferase
VGRVLAAPAVASHPVPPFAGSMVDGFAVRAADVDGARAESPVELRIVADIMAGDPGLASVGPGEAARIMTGAPVPPGADAVVMLEWTSWTEERVSVERPVAPGAALRAAGEDLAPGDVAVEAGTPLGPAETGVLASIGWSRPSVRPRPRVAVIATGDELRDVDEELTPGCIRSSNHWTIAGQVGEAGGVALPLGIARDDPADLAARVEKARVADVLVTSGGVSVGDRDQVQEVLGEAGFEKIFWRVLSSPGKPLLFGRLGSTLVFGLPGNPVSSMVAFENFVRPTLRRLQGDRYPDPLRLWARLSGTLRAPRDRRHFARVRLIHEPDGPRIEEVVPHGSGNLRSMVRANALAIVPEGVDRVDDGATVEVVVIGGGSAGRR